MFRAIRINSMAVGRGENEYAIKKESAIQLKKNRKFDQSRNMASPDIIHFVELSLSQGLPKSKIAQALKSGGWTEQERLATRVLFLLLQPTGI